jgi:hypothetical protein
VHKGIVDGLLSNTVQVRDVNKPTDQEIAQAEEDLFEVVKAALLISGVNKQ